MTRLPRLALGTVQPDADERAMRWAVLSLLERHGPQIQTFCSKACFDPLTGVSSVTGQSQRHLDSWLMSRDVCREIFLRGTQSCDLAVVEGQFESDGFAACSPVSVSHGQQTPRTSGGSDGEGRLETLCDWLDLPRIVIVDARQLACCQDIRPAGKIDGILLDAVPDGRAGVALRTDLEVLWGAPVLGTLPRLPRLRGAISKLTAGCSSSASPCRELADALSESLDVARLLNIARSRDFPAAATGLFDNKQDLYRCNIAVAYDEAFNCYFPDALDLLEYRGARIQDFSPLRGESLPPGTHVVYFGCGNLPAHAEELSRNCCFRQALRSYAAAGGRIYAECAGMAYLCEQIVLPNQKPIAMAGVLPAVAVRNEQAGPARPAEVCLEKDCWMGPSGARLRGYGNQAWQLKETGPLTHYAGDSLIGWQRTIGSRLHLNFAALPDYLDRFFRPLREPMRATR